MPCFALVEECGFVFFELTCGFACSSDHFLLVSWRVASLIFNCCIIIDMSARKEVNMTPSEIITSISLLLGSAAALVKAIAELVKVLRKPKK